ncbi:hypothetical protein RHMOL_Rhmol07G0116400 [Rhododendron molle]|uniref:Uncharacterized protein n=1 Tax=Rhododendron molle TaxID=49168 RepID=A0ACC0N0R0_RHOML|nr:hypothetical protein RHMOL_Rhmol07G0116400 [Rhododendron molle]
MLKCGSTTKSSPDILNNDSTFFGCLLDCSFHFVSCNCNRAAHVTAKYALSINLSADLKQRLFKLGSA